MAEAAAGAVVTYFLGAGATGTAATVLYAASYVVVNAAIAYGVSYAAQQLAGKPKTAASSSPQGIKFNARSSMEPQRIIYGERVVGGPFVLISETNATSVKQSTFMSVIPSGSPYTVTLPDVSGYSSTSSVQETGTDETGYTITYATFTATGGAPAAGEYSVTSGVYTFNSADAGKVVNIVWLENVTTAYNHYLHVVIALAGHECDSIPSVYFGPDEIGTLDGSGNVTSGKFAGVMRVKKHLGAADQAADSDLTTELSTVSWGTNHRGRGVCYVYLRLAFAPDIYTSGLLPITAKVRGKKCIDPRSYYSSAFNASVNTNLASYGAPDWLALNYSVANDIMLVAADDNVQLTSVQINFGVRLVHSLISNADDYTVSATVRRTTARDTGSVAARCSSFGNFYCTETDSSNDVLLIRYDGGARVVLETTAATIPTDTTMTSSITVSGTGATVTITYSVNGVGNTYADTHANRKTGGAPGFVLSRPGGSTQADVWVDDFVVGSPVWTQNPAIIMRDYCTSTYGFDAETTDIDDATVIVASNICDESADKPGGGTHTRYVCDYTFTLDRAPPDIMRDMLLTMVGWWTYSKGLIRIFAGAYVTADSVALTTADLRGPLSVQARIPRRNLFNSVRGLYFAEEKNFEYTDYPQITNSTYVSDDDGKKLYLDVNFDGVLNGARCQRLAQVLLFKARDSLRVHWPGNMRCYRRDVCDVVPVTLSQLGWPAKTFRVVDRKYIPGTGVDLVLEEEDSTNYSWSASDGVAIDASPDTDLQNPFFVPQVLGLAVTSAPADDVIGADGTILCRLKVTWTKAVNVYVLANGGQVEIWHRPSGQVKWNGPDVVAGDSTTHYIAGIPINSTYQVTARFRNSLGRYGPWTAFLTVTNSSTTRGPSIANWLQNERFQIPFVYNAALVVALSPQSSGMQEPYAFPVNYDAALSAIPSREILRSAVDSTYQAFVEAGRQLTFTGSHRFDDFIVYGLRPKYVPSNPYGNLFKLLPGRRYQFSANVAAQSGAAVGIQISTTMSGDANFFGYGRISDGTSLASIISSAVVYGNSTTFNGGTDALTNWGQVTIIFDAPTSLQFGQVISAIDAQPKIFAWKASSGSANVRAFMHNMMFGETLANQTVPAPFSQYGGFDAGQYWNSQAGMATSLLSTTMAVTSTTHVTSQWVVNDDETRYNKLTEFNLVSPTTCDIVLNANVQFSLIQASAASGIMIFWDGTKTTSNNVTLLGGLSGHHLVTTVDSNGARANLALEYRTTLSAGSVRSFQVLGRSQNYSGGATIHWNVVNGHFKVEEIRR